MAAEVSDSHVLRILSWLSWSFEDNDDLVASRVKFAELASWLADQEIFDTFEERDDASLDGLLAHLAHLPQAKALAPDLESAASTVSKIGELSRRASYDAHYEGDEPEFVRIKAEWEDVVRTLEKLEASGILSAKADTP